jgi:hypothetical protein
MSTGSCLRNVCLTITFAAALLVTACTSESERLGMGSDAAGAEAALNALTADEQAAGWQLLWDGQTFDGWRGMGSDRVPQEHWAIADGAIHKKASGDVPVAADGQPVAGGDLTTIQTFENFDFSFDWKISPGGNSGIKYNVSEELSTTHPPRRAALGFEYQILDDEGHPDANQGVDGNRKAAGLYDMMGPNDQKRLNPVGEWNHGRIVVQGNHVEHWLNGAKVVEFEIGSPTFDSLLAASKYVDIAGFADKRAGHIVLQDHNDDAWYRNLKIRELAAP